ncbi:hypothetical protein [Nocardioides limicola]|uniref:hypothetical protein n=1 Tax=Nocardioides limicola TaxID=2803368 RepID=UPI00193C4BB4|nr:hypothetical protein [Nocardioides sp. DJM-14]
MSERSTSKAALIVASLALVLSATTGATAAVVTSQQIAKNAVKSKHIAKSAVKSRHIARGTIKYGDLAPAAREQLQGQQGPAGPAGPSGPAGEITPLASGETMSGPIAAAGAKLDNGTGGYLSAVIQYPRPLAAPAPNGALAQVWGTTYTADCPGPGQAAAGKLCIYSSLHSLVANPYIYSDDAWADGRNGVVVFWPFNGNSGNAWVAGSWAYTAP